MLVHTISTQVWHNLPYFKEGNSEFTQNGDKRSGQNRGLTLLKSVDEVGLPLSKFQVDPMKKWASDLNSSSKVMQKYKILGQY